MRGAGGRRSIPTYFRHKWPFVACAAVVLPLSCDQPRGGIPCGRLGDRVRQRGLPLRAAPPPAGRACPALGRGRRLVRARACASACMPLAPPPKMSGSARRGRRPSRRGSRRGSCGARAPRWPCAPWASSWRAGGRGCGHPLRRGRRLVSFVRAGLAPARVPGGHARRKCQQKKGPAHRWASPPSRSSVVSGCPFRHPPYTPRVSVAAKPTTSGGAGLAVWLYRHDENTFPPGRLVRARAGRCRAPASCPPKMPAENVRHGLAPRGRGGRWPLRP